MDCKQASPKIRLRPRLGHKSMFDVFRARGTCLVAADVRRPISVKRNLKTEANVVVSECTG